MRTIFSEFSIQATRLMPKRVLLPGTLRLCMTPISILSPAFAPRAV
jgi:hypothetical protein